MLFIVITDLSGDTHLGLLADWILPLVVNAPNLKKKWNYTVQYHQNYILSIALWI